MGDEHIMRAYVLAEAMSVVVYGLYVNHPEPCSSASRKSPRPHRIRPGRTVDIEAMRDTIPSSADAVISTAPYPAEA